MSVDFKVIEYINSIIKDLEKMRFFDESELNYVNKEDFYDQILIIASNNLEEFDDPMLTEEQFNQLVSDLRLKEINKMLESLHTKGLIDIKSMDSEGNFGYTINENGKEYLNNLKKK